MSTTFFKYLNIPYVPDPRMCPVCGREAPDGEVHRPHFGAISCYSCRAFFRRSVHFKTYKSLVCKEDESCSLSINLSRKCPRCRLVKCISSGMNANFVLTEREKKIRFKNYFKKKDNKMKTRRLIEHSESKVDSSDPAITNFKPRTPPTGQVDERTNISSSISSFEDFQPIQYDVQHSSWPNPSQNEQKVPWGHHWLNNECYLENVDSSLTFTPTNHEEFTNSLHQMANNEETPNHYNSTNPLMASYQQGGPCQDFALSNMADNFIQSINLSSKEKSSTVYTNYYPEIQETVSYHSQ